MDGIVLILVFESISFVVFIVAVVDIMIEDVLVPPVNVCSIVFDVSSNVAAVVICSDVGISVIDSIESVITIGDVKIIDVSSAVSGLSVIGVVVVISDVAEFVIMIDSVVGVNVVTMNAGDEVFVLVDIVEDNNFVVVEDFFVIDDAAIVGDFFVVVVLEDLVTFIGVPLDVFIALGFVGFPYVIVVAVDFRVPFALVLILDATVATLNGGAVVSVVVVMAPV